MTTKVKCEHCGKQTDIDKWEPYYRIEGDGKVWRFKTYLTRSLIVVKGLTLKDNNETHSIRP